MSSGWGVSNDRSGIYSDLGGLGSEMAVRMAVEDFGGKAAGKSVQVIGADNQNKADVASALVRRWFDTQGLVAVVDGGASSAGLAAQGVAREKRGTALISGGFAGDFSGKQCSPLSTQWVRQIGIRSVDDGEKRLVHQAGLEVFDMRYLDEMGMRATMQAALAGLDDDTHLHVSFDVDFLDPEIAPGVGTTVMGGPTYREAQLCMEMIADTGLMRSLDVVELNPAFDVRNKTADLAVDLIESLFGKSTLVRRGS